MAMDAAAQLEVDRLREEVARLQKLQHKWAHDLKNPLAAVREFVALLIDEVGGPVNDTQREYLTTALECCDRLNVMLIEGLTDVDGKNER